MVVKHRKSGLLPNFDKDIVYVSNLKELNYITIDDKKAVHIGSTTKYVDIEQSPLVPELIKEIVREIASPNIRNMASLAGNVANASPAGDGIVGLYLLDAEVVLISVRGERRMKVSEFIFGVRKIKREQDEIIKEIIIPNYEGITYWKKVGSRAAESISKVTFAGAYKVEKGVLVDLRLAYGSVSITAARNRAIEEKYIGMKISAISQKIPAICEDFMKLVNPITDQRSTKEYRSKVAENITKKFLEDIK